MKKHEHFKWTVAYIQNFSDIFFPISPKPILILTFISQQKNLNFKMRKIITGHKDRDNVWYNYVEL